MIEVGRPVEAKVPVRVTASGKDWMSFLKTAMDASACGAKYHSIATS